MILSLSVPIMDTIEQLTESVDKDTKHWMLGGSCGLALQGVSLGREPRDVDIYADEIDAKRLQEQWKLFAIDVPEWNETLTYRSLLSHYQIGEVPVELVGQFIVTTPNCQYKTIIHDSLWNHRITYEIAHSSIALMPLAHELVFNILRQREDRVSSIARVINTAPEEHIAAMSAVLANCSAPEYMAALVGGRCPNIKAHFS
ncbi:hypothetical protein [Paenibacillus alvei]|uniref:hypothetical protein n=1 Tax=Paenibacillus alvei TaxID=44250 RepID=UPI0013D8F68A|nr:hypothetical protein [Paenibacillus alvei]NEZ42961.1 hypothetical protein [Paenibacillus alvei]